MSGDPKTSVSADTFEQVRAMLRQRVDELIAAAASGDEDEIELHRQMTVAAFLSAAAMAFDIGQASALIFHTPRRLH